MIPAPKVEVTPRIPKPGTQAARVLDTLIDAKGDWVNGQYFCRSLWLTQFHAVIWTLENRYGWPIEHSADADEYGFKSYRIVDPAAQVSVV